MTRPRLLDLFCGAGGAGVGYQRAGFDVVGVDIKPQPNYPFEFIQADALDVAEDARRMGFNAVHASPPCQQFTAYRRRGAGVGDSYLNLIPETREVLWAVGLPYVIENVPGAPLRLPQTLCGSMFDLDVRRHRLFESNLIIFTPKCRHHVWTERKYPAATNRTNRRFTCEVGVYRIPLEQQKQAMGIDWPITLRELSEAIPPAYTHWIGRELLASMAVLPAGDRRRIWSTPLESEAPDLDD